MRVVCLNLSMGVHSALAGGARNEELSRRRNVAFASVSVPLTYRGNIEFSFESIAAFQTSP